MTKRTSFCVWDERENLELMLSSRLWRWAIAHALGFRMSSSTRKWFKFYSAGNVDCSNLRAHFVENLKNILTKTSANWLAARSSSSCQRSYALSQDARCHSLEIQFVSAKPNYSIFHDSRCQSLPRNHRPIRVIIESSHWTMTWNVFSFPIPTLKSYLHSLSLSVFVVIHIVTISLSLCIPHYTEPRVQCVCESVTLQIPLHYRDSLTFWSTVNFHWFIVVQFQFQFEFWSISHFVSFHSFCVFPVWCRMMVQMESAVFGHNEVSEWSGI